MAAQSITVDPEVFEALKARARPFEDHTPNDVLRRLFGLDAGPQVAAPSPTTGPRVKLLAHSEYELPLLRYLAEIGGRAPAQEVIEAVGRAVGDKLTERDWELIRSGRIRWKNRVQFVRLRLAERGELERASPRGTWEITEKGIARVREADGLRES